MYSRVVLPCLLSCQVYSPFDADPGDDKKQTAVLHGLATKAVGDCGFGTSGKCASQKLDCQQCDWQDGSPPAPGCEARLSHGCQCGESPCGGGCTGFYHYGDPDFNIELAMSGFFQCKGGGGGGSLFLSVACVLSSSTFTEALTHSTSGSGSCAC